MEWWCGSCWELVRRSSIYSDATTWCNLRHLAPLASRLETGAARGLGADWCVVRSDRSRIVGGV